jgi:tetratricopeptide (TPR) repeat protein
LFRHAVGVYQGYRDAPDTNFGMVGNNLATSLQSLGQYRGAHHVLGQVLQVFPDTPKFRAGMAFSELSLANFDAAERQFDEALRLYPGYPIAVSMKSRLPALREIEAAPHGDTIPDLTKRAKHAIDMGRTRDAFKLLNRILDRGNLPRNELEGALFFAQRLADPETTKRLFRAYVQSLEGEAPPAGVADAYLQRQRAAERLLAMWPSLGLPLPRL